MKKYLMVALLFIMANKNVLAFNTFECGNKSNTFNMTYITSLCPEGPRLTVNLDGLKFNFPDISVEENPLFSDISAFDASMNCISFHLQTLLAESQLNVIMKGQTFLLNCVGINSNC